ncbi:MAG: glycosyltransferase family 2 protein [Prevotella sp.]|nr:glycosyltransferase family 2 protein [Prevotella sp.]
MISPKVSIIVPVYNSGASLRKCIGSILEQSYTNFELLLIDDGSTDSSSILCEEFASLDDRIRTFHKDNGGVSSARNMGLENAVGEWVAFVDSDDWLQKDYLSNLMRCLDYPFIVGGFKRFGEIVDESVPAGTYPVDIAQDLQKMWNASVSKFIFWYVWGKMFRHDLIRENGIAFQEKMKYNEDNCFILEYMSIIDSFLFVDRSEYMHLFEGERYRKYNMDFSTFKIHVEHQEKSFQKLENKTGHRYSLVRQNVHRRFFDCFIFNLLNRPTYSLYKMEIDSFKEYDRNGTYLDEVSYSIRRRWLRFLLFKMHDYIGYTLRRILLKVAY